MAKGRNRGNREAKKPKAKKVLSVQQLPILSSKGIAAQNAPTQRKA
jgi:hypothetical protein